MVIEDSERFGLAQLHQIRGRVGRSDKQSWCFLYTNEEEERGMERLQYFSTHNDGMEIAEYDLKLRGPGEVYGTRQSGIPNLKIADITNLRQLKQAREYATLLLKKGIKHISLFSDE
jgi:ATP-dependent DNA helicase RecG